MKVPGVVIRGREGLRSGESDAPRSPKCQAEKEASRRTDLPLEVSGYTRSPASATTKKAGEVSNASPHRAHRVAVLEIVDCVLAQGSLERNKGRRGQFAPWVSVVRGGR